MEAVDDGRFALESARCLSPNLIVLNIMLPELDGFEVTRILRKEISTPILMLTVRGDFDRVVLTTISGGKRPSKLPLLSCDRFIISEPLGL